MEKMIFSLLPSEQIVYRFSNPLEAINRFYSEYKIVGGLEVEKSLILRQLESKLKGAEIFIEKNRQRLNEVSQDGHFQQWADLIMANIHLIHPGMEKVTLPDFNNHNQLVDIRLKKELNAQTNAQILYRKAKNRQIEIQKFMESIDRKEKEKSLLMEQVTTIKAENDIRVVAAISLKEKKKEARKTLPYHEAEFKGFKIWIGKNAVSNDTLTLKYAHK